MSKCNDQSVKTHEIEWQPQQCVDGGIFRAKKNYTNVLASGFNTNIGYSGHYYGIRKYTGLIPETAYKITIEGKAGDGLILDVPREIIEWEYGTNENVDYSGIKLVNNDFRTENAFFGKSVASSEDYLAVGLPYYSFEDTNEYLLNKAGTVLLYKRNPQPSGSDWSQQYDKANWILEQQVNLPSGFLRDYIYRRETINTIVDSSGQSILLPFNIQRNNWKVGQEGRQFGYSLDLCSTDNIDPSLGEDKKNILVVGGPHSSWNRSFPPINPSGISFGLFIFTDDYKKLEIEQTIGFETIKIPPYTHIENVAFKNKDLIFKYFCNPPTTFDAKINIIQCLTPIDDRIIEDLPLPKPDNYFKYNTLRHFDSNEGYAQTEEYQIVESGLFKTLQTAFFNAFPYDENKINNNIPPILSFYIDNSFSFGGKSSVSPALDRFINFYKEYSFASGLSDFNGIRSSGEILIFQDTSDDWVGHVIKIIDSTISIDKLKENNNFRFFASSIGEFNPDLPESNLSPPSGGNVYIFEKESGSWNLIQTIESPTQSNQIYPDRFGHDVKISDNGEIVVIGSPYIDKSIIAYEYDKNVKHPFYDIESWLLLRKNSEIGSNHYSNLYNRLNILKSELNIIEAYKKMYLELSSTDKYKLRTDIDFKPNIPYQETFSYFKTINGSWPWLVSYFASNPRLGYSVAVNEEGSIIAAGSPTDCLNEFDDSNVYYSHNRPEYSTWHSYVNTGSVRVFESRKYFPHNSVVEYGKFGNLEYEISNSGEKQFFITAMSGIYKDLGLNFTKTDFADVDIPENAGLMFIITPQIDALSDEILTNIKNWLSLGDRNLVLVGNDPIWEKDGLYLESNNIINDILEKLDCKVTIVPARNRNEALVDNVDTEKSNIIQSSRPYGSFSTYISTQNTLTSFGVADIKPYRINEKFYNCDQSVTINCGNFTESVNRYKIVNDKFNIPIKNLGDLRASWQEFCTLQGLFGGGCGPVSWPVALPHFINTDNYSPYVKGSKLYDYDNLCIFNPPNESYFVNYSFPSNRKDFVPLYTPLQENNPIIIFYPGTPERSGFESFYETVGMQELPPAEHYEFKQEFSEPSILWTADNNNYNTINLNITNTVGQSNFKQPEFYISEKPILQAETSSLVESKEQLEYYDEANFLATCNYKDTNSELYLLATTYFDNKNLYRLNNDYIKFYFNMVAKDANGNAKVAQLGDFTGRTSFKDLNPESDLQNILLQTRNSVDLNVSLFNLLRGKQINEKIYEYDVCFLLQPINVPTNEQIEQLKNWLQRGNKKLILVYNTVSFSEISKIDKLCENLEFIMRPMFLPAKGKYARIGSLGATITNKNGDSIINTFSNVEPKTEDGTINLKGGTFSNSIVQDSKINIGYPEKKTTISPVNNGFFRSELVNIIPIDPKGAEKITSFGSSIYDAKRVSFNVHNMDTGIAKISFPVIPNSGYRIFFNFASEHPNEKLPLTFFTNTKNYPKRGAQHLTNYSFEDTKIPLIYNNAIVENEFIEPGYFLSKTMPQSDYTQLVLPMFTNLDFGIGKNKNYINFVNQNISLDGYFKVPSDVNELNIYIDGSFFTFEDKLNLYPVYKTARLISIYGYLCPYDNLYSKRFQAITEERFRPTFFPAIPDSSGIYYPEPSPLTTDSLKYCPKDSCIDLFSENLPIEDGPVIVAQGFETFSNFQNGVNRSRITVISDSSLIQGKYIADSGGIIKQENKNFIQSLYPFTNFPSTSRGRSFSDHITKIQAPERLTPQRLFSSTGNDGQNLRFKPISTDSSGIISILPASSGQVLNTFIENFNFSTFVPSYAIEMAGGSTFERLIMPKDGEQTEKDRKSVIQTIENLCSQYGAYTKFSQVIDGKYYQDNYNGVTQIMKDTGFDYLDFHIFQSGYPGDLFGYSVDIYKDKILIGSPFAGYNSEIPISWSGVYTNTSRYNKPSGTTVGYNGGAGSVYLYEISNDASSKTPFGYPSRWKLSKKFRPDSINIGQDTNNLDLFNSGIVFGQHNYKADDLNLSIVNDQFGHSVKIYNDIIAIGAPGHDFENYSETIFNSGQFMRKAFMTSFDIPQRNVYNLGSSGIRQILQNSGIAVLNNGAIFTYENRMSNWQDRIQKWEFIEKIVPQGYNSRLQKTYVGSSEVPSSGSENDRFGSFIDINKSMRTDSSYSIIAGVPYHKFGSGISDQIFDNAGAVYIYDGMLRRMPYSIMNENNFIQAKVFGFTDPSGNPNIRLSFSNDEANKVYATSGIIFTTRNGEIFLEASGQDFTDKMYIRHRPYITSINGEFVFGEHVDNVFTLFTDGQPALSSGKMNLFSNAPDRETVYNNLGLYQSAVLGIASGVPSGLFLYTDCPSGIIISESGFALYASGTGFSPEILSLEIRGK